MEFTMSVLSSFWCFFEPKWETTTSPWQQWCSRWALTCQPSLKHSGFFTRKLLHPPSLVPLNPLPLEISGYSSSGQALSKLTGCIVADGAACPCLASKALVGRPRRAEASSEASRVWGVGPPRGHELWAQRGRDSTAGARSNPAEQEPY